jgi:hypothetical protein
VPLRHVGNIPHRVMAFEMATAEARWQAARHPLFNFFRRTRHPDIDVSRRDPALRTLLSRLQRDTAVDSKIAAVHMA